MTPSVTCGYKNHLKTSGDGELTSELWCRSWAIKELNNYGADLSGWKYDKTTNMTIINRLEAKPFSQTFFQPLGCWIENLDNGKTLKVYYNDGTGNTGTTSCSKDQICVTRQNYDVFSGFNTRRLVPSSIYEGQQMGICNSGVKFFCLIM